MDRVDALWTLGDVGAVAARSRPTGCGAWLPLSLASALPPVFAASTVVGRARVAADIARGRREGKPSPPPLPPTAAPSLALDTRCSRLCSAAALEKFIVAASSLERLGFIAPLPRAGFTVVARPPTPLMVKACGCTGLAGRAERRCPARSTPLRLADAGRRLDADDGLPVELWLSFVGIGDALRTGLDGFGEKPVWTM